ncbi:MAG: hypothetical protein HY352_02160 [Candidatus Omnitrophica bacterium]|nr:hypothetical protein [Candidatus Omnitrophota bacterium]
MRGEERSSSHVVPQALRWVFAASVLYGSIMGRTFADQEVPVEVVKVPAAPIDVLEATGQLLEYQAVPSRVGAAHHTRTKSANIHSAQFDHWEGQLRYRNSSKRSVSAVRFQWKLLDAFDQTRWVVEVNDNQTLTLGEMRQRRWEQRVSQTEEVVKALLTVKMVRFQDGTLWPPEPQELPASEADDAIRTERKRLRKLYDDQGIEGLLNALHE